MSNKTLAWLNALSGVANIFLGYINGWAWEIALGILNLLCATVYLYWINNDKSSL